MTAAPGYDFPDSRLDAELHRRGIDPAGLTSSAREELRLCAACLAGGEAAWAELLAAHRGGLIATAARLTGSIAAADELVADLLADLATGDRLARFTGRGSLAGWLRAVLTRRFLDARRAAGRARLVEWGEVVGEPATAPGQGGGCREWYRPGLLEELTGRLGAELNRLPERQAAFLNLYYFQGRTLAAAAAWLGVHESSACRWNTKILSRLRREVVGHLRRRLGWSAAAVADFLERCLEALAGRLAAARTARAPGPGSELCKGRDPGASD